MWFTELWAYTQRKQDDAEFLHRELRAKLLIQRRAVTSERRASEIWRRSASEFDGLQFYVHLSGLSGRFEVSSPQQLITNRLFIIAT